MKIFRTKQIEDNQGVTLVSEGVEANYQDMLNYQLNRITPVCIPSKKANNHSIPSDEFAAILLTCILLFSTSQ